MAEMGAKGKLSIETLSFSANYLQLLLCMFVSHLLLDNPLFGSSVFLFANIWTVYYQGNLYRIHSGSRHSLMWMLLIASAAAGITVLFLYPIVMRQPLANYVSFLVVLLTVRNLLCHRIDEVFSTGNLRDWAVKIALQLVFMLPAVVFSRNLFDSVDRTIIIVWFAVTGLVLLLNPQKVFKIDSVPPTDSMMNISSYKIFRHMSLYSQIAFSLGILMYICYMSFGQRQFVAQTYFMMVVWLLFVQLFSFLAGNFTIRRGLKMSLSMFIFGAVLWIVGTVEMFEASGTLNYALWTFCWGLGMSCVDASLNGFSRHFEMVARVADTVLVENEMYFRRRVSQTVALIFSYCIMLCILSVWNFVIPTVTDIEVPVLFKKIMVQLPVLFMLLGVWFAMRQPLNRRIQEKLFAYYDSSDRKVNDSLRKTLVAKYRVRFGVKIIALMLRPFMHLKVYGRENMDGRNYPSVFVCNHGVFYGPVAAVIYLPTYFRPWVDRKMLDRERSSEEMYRRFVFRIPLLGERAKRRLAYHLSAPVVWALNSFNPVPVERDNLRNVMTTFNATIDVLDDGDNVLLFPERPHRVKYGERETVVHETETVGAMFTGFANIGKMYFDRTGRNLRFYPIYADKDEHTFRIGVPVIYNPDNPHRQEKERIADQLRERMLALRAERRSKSNRI